MRISDWSSTCALPIYVLYHSCCFPCVAPVSHGSVNRFFRRGAMAEIMCATVRADHRHKWMRSEEHTSELQSLMRISYAVFCLKNKTNINKIKNKSIHKG